MPVSRSCVYGRQIEFESIPPRRRPACTAAGEPFSYQSEEAEAEEAAAAAPGPEWRTKHRAHLVSFQNARR